MRGQVQAMGWPGDESGVASERATEKESEEVEDATKGRHGTSCRQLSNLQQSQQCVCVCYAGQCRPLPVAECELTRQYALSRPQPTLPPTMASTTSDQRLSLHSRIVSLQQLILSQESSISYVFLLHLQLLQRLRPRVSPLAETLPSPNSVLC